MCCNENLVQYIKSYKLLTFHTNYITISATEENKKPHERSLMETHYKEMVAEFLCVCVCETGIMCHMKH